MTGIIVAKTHRGQDLELPLEMANRHGLIAGATGTGKTVTLRTLAESFSEKGIPVFVADVKGDLAGSAMVGGGNARIEERYKELGLGAPAYRARPTLFWDVYGERGHPIRTTVSEFGPLLFSRLLDLNETQTGVLEVLFKLADDQGLLLLDLKDLKSLLSWAGNHASELRNDYGNIAPATIGAIQRSLLGLEQAGGDHFFGEPALRLEHLMQRDFSGQGVISVLDASKLINDPRAYTSFLLWMLAELFETLPEVGDQPAPKLVFFFDEAHLLFADAPDALREKVEQVVRLIRSKGVGVYFVTQSPLDLPDSVLRQLGHRVQHALRAFTPQEQKAVKAAATTFRANPAVDVEKAITELAIGEALVSLLDSSNTPAPVERALIIPPLSRLGALSDAERKAVLDRSPLRGIYEQTIDRESAFELLAKKVESEAKAKAEMNEEKANSKASKSSSPFNAMMTSAMRSIGTQIGRQLMRGLMGSLKTPRR